MEPEPHISDVQHADISETWLHTKYPEAFAQLLLDHTTGKNIIWATDSYNERGEGYNFYDEITAPLITGEQDRVIRPRAIKSLEEQQQRVKDKAEVFTPSWICNAQNNLIDEAWFGYPNAFNEELTDERGNHTWIPTEEKIKFPDTPGRSWRDYVKDMRLEITCGEAPYLVSRYDAVTGEAFVHPENPSEANNLNMRIGLLDRKLRVVSENTETSADWLQEAKKALECTYGYEWQGDSLLLAREAMFVTVLEYYHAKFGKDVPSQSINGIAYIISWNLWQMDGLKYVIPGSCELAAKTKNYDGYQSSFDLFESSQEENIECSACKTGKGKHIGIKAKIRDWKAFHDSKRKKDPNKTNIPFVNLINQAKYGK